MHVEESGASGASQVLAPAPGEHMAADFGNVDGHLPHGLGGVEREDHPGFAAQSAHLGGWIHQPALGGHMHERHQRHIIGRKGALQCSEIDLPMVVVVHEHKLAARALL